MSPKAIAFSLLLSVFFFLLLQTHARKLPSKNSNTNYVEFHPSEQTDRIPASDLSREIAHSFRLPLPNHLSRKKSVEIPYGNDMVRSPSTKKFRKGFKGVDQDANLKKKMKWISRYFNWVVNDLHMCVYLYYIPISVVVWYVNNWWLCIKHIILHLYGMDMFWYYYAVVVWLIFLSTTKFESRSSNLWLIKSG